MAICEGLKMIRHLDRGDEVDILTDNQALVHALNDFKETSLTIAKTREKLNEIADRNPVTIHWVKAHIGIYGNEMADILAKEGTKMTCNIHMPVSKAELDKQIMGIITKMWNDQWIKRTDCRQTKILLPEVDLRKSKVIMGMSRENVSRIVRAVTGHDFRRKHEGLVKASQNTLCRFCEEKAESSSHIILDCPRLASKRTHYFNRPLGLSITPNWEPKHLAAFLSDPIISEMEAPTRE